MADDYSGAIDWDEIYNRFHDPEQVADRIRTVIKSVEGPVVFCGFPKVASLLSEHHNIIFVDCSPAMIRIAESRYTNIQEVVRSEVEPYLQSNTAETIVISGRLSAFWHRSEAFEKLASAILAHPRAKVLIDYFDLSKVGPGSQSRFIASDGHGWWQYQQFASYAFQTPPMTMIDVDIGYTFANQSTSYTAHRAYFDATAILRWHQDTFSHYTSTLAEGLLPGDPSFAVTMDVTE